MRQPAKRKQARKPPESRAADPRSMDDDPVVQGILTAISHKRLKPGAKLGEDSLAKAFGTSRIHIRQALAHLSSRKVVTQFPNRGAFIYRPTWEEAQEICAARRVIEAATVSATIDRLDDAGIAVLTDHMQREAAHDRNDRWASLSLTAEFHILVAKLAGNAVLLEIARELMLRTSLAIATFEVPGSPDCSPDAHPGICQFILAQNRPAAIDAMVHHLDDIERRMKPDGSRPDPDDLSVIFREIGVAPVARTGA
jgi:DNA-binding GntR family transcriptional regulator